MHRVPTKYLVILLNVVFILDDMSTRIDDLEKNIGEILNSQDGD